MKARELIRILQSVDPDATVAVEVENPHAESPIDSSLKLRVEHVRRVGAGCQSFAMIELEDAVTLTTAAALDRTVTNSAAGGGN